MLNTCVSHTKQILGINDPFILTPWQLLKRLKHVKKPKAPKKTAQEVAVERRQTIMLDKEIEEQEDRFRALSRGKRGTVSLLGGAPKLVRKRQVVVVRLGLVARLVGHLLAA
jgi:hypothetical protein